MTRYLIVIFLMVAPGLSGTAQRLRIDSLHQVLPQYSEDSLIVYTLIELGWAYRKVDKDSAQTYYRLARERAKVSDNPRLYNYTLNESAVFSRFEQMPDSIVYYHQKALERAILISDHQSVHYVLRNLPDHYTNFGEYENSLNVLDEIGRYLLRHQDSSGLAEVARLRAENYNFMARYQKSLEHYHQALDYLQTNPDKRLHAGAYNGIAIVQKKLGYVDKAREYFLKAMISPTNRYDSVMNAARQVNLGLLEKDEGNFELSEDYMLKSYGVFNRTSLHYGNAAVTHNLASLYKEWGRYDTALTYFEASQKLALKNGYDDLQSKNAAGAAEVWLALGELKKAGSRGLEALRLAKKVRSAEDEMQASKVLHQVYARQGHYGKAYEALKTFHQLSDSLFNEEKSTTVAALQARYEFQEKETNLLKQRQHIELLEKEHQLFQFRVAIGILLLTAAVIIILLLYKRQQARKRLAETQLLLARQKEQALSSELSVKNHELINMALQIVERNDFMETLNRQIKKLTQNGLAGNQKVVELGKMVNENLNLTRYRKEFKTYIDSVYDAFVARIKGKFPELSDHDLRLAILLRMNLSSKEIAAIMNISPKSVDMNRYRLRKKINLDNDQKLQDFIREI